jgi:hypothetical protein
MSSIFSDFQTDFNCEPSSNRQNEIQEAHFQLSFINTQCYKSYTGNACYSLEVKYLVLMAHKIGLEYPALLSTLSTY